MKANWRVDVWGGEPLIADIVDIDTKRPVAQTVSTEVARFIVARCAGSDPNTRIRELEAEVARLNKKESERC